MALDCRQGPAAATQLLIEAERPERREWWGQLWDRRNHLATERCVYMHMHATYIHTHTRTYIHMCTHMHPVSKRDGKGVR